MAQLILNEERLKIYDILQYCLCKSHFQNSREYSGSLIFASVNFNHLDGSLFQLLETLNLYWGKYLYAALIFSGCRVLSDTFGIFRNYFSVTMSEMIPRRPWKCSAFAEKMLSSSSQPYKNSIFFVRIINPTVTCIFWIFQVAIFQLGLALW